MSDLYQILRAWMLLAHAAARRRNGAAFREAADMQELWDHENREGRGR
ncbi:hypothetical protein [Falsiroseomonas tokyonensis]|uniref:Uncharacterized protein n=1 Tax=Falsiroseomonas tokyonensis TaxID=430521 RepID=A0ABV7C298_9PROT|nr:hypothetical protein [Falsiroseomonas tokyonensis]MBU8540241.1 hypothetical protein [Falsiroseomonas tokyonensis]